MSPVLKAKIGGTWVDVGVGPQGPIGPAGPSGSTGPAGPGVPAGGTTGQVLLKASATDYATSWGAAPAPGNDSVTDAILRNSAATSVIGRAANSTGDPADIAASADGTVLQRNAGVLSFSQILNAHIADNTIQNAKIFDRASRSVMGRAVNSSGPVADIVAVTDGHALRLSGGVVGFGPIDLANASAITGALAAASGGVPSGGATGQVLSKVDATSYNLAWIDPPAGTPADNSITNLKLRDSAGLSVIGRSANTTGDPADIVAATDGQVLRRSGTAIGFGALNLATTNAVTGALTSLNGGTGLALSPLGIVYGDLLVGDAGTTKFSILPRGLDGQILVARAAAALSIEWQNPKPGLFLAMYVNSSGTPTIITDNSGGTGAGASRSGAGVYPVTVGTNRGNYIVVAVPMNTLAFTASVSNLSSTGFTVRTFNAAGTATDSDFMLAVF